MKKILLIALLGFMSLASYAQGTVTETVRWNTTLQRYEVYALPTFTSSAFTMGPSQVTVVVPSSVPDSPLVVTGVNPAGQWADNTDVYAPSSAPNLDFHAVATNGGKVATVAGQELLLFYFTLPGGLCTPGVRLFVTGSDPNSSAAGMQGGDFQNTMDNGLATTGAGIYVSNYNNTGTTCTTCSIVAPTLIK